MFPRKTSTIAGSAVTIDRSGNSAPEIEGGQKGSIIFFLKTSVKCMLHMV